MRLPWWILSIIVFLGFSILIVVTNKILAVIKPPMSYEEQVGNPNFILAIGIAFLVMILLFLFMIKHDRLKVVMGTFVLTVLFIKALTYEPFSSLFINIPK